MMNSIFLGVIASQGQVTGGGGGPGPGPGGAWSWNPDFVGTDHTLTNSDKTIVTAGNETTQAVMSKQVIPRVNAVYYWELQYNAAGDSNDSGRLGVIVPRKFDMSFITEGYTAGEGAEWTISGAGGLRHNGSFITGGAGISLGANDTGMFAWNPFTGELWFGENGVWVDDPDADPASFTCTVFADTYRLTAQLREAGRELTLLTDPAELTYPIPASATALTTIVQPTEAETDAQRVMVVTSPQKSSELAVDQMRVYVVTET